MNTIYALTCNRDVTLSRKMTAVIGVGFFVLATALSAYVRIPVGGSPVPITLQTFFVLLSGAILGRKLGVFSQLGYILLGVAGIPVFQNASFGVPYLFGPTGGYIIGFVFASYLIGFLTMRCEKIGMIGVTLSFIAGSLAILVFGALWLAYLYKMGIRSALFSGVLPFIPGDLAKVLLAAVIYSGISQRAKRIFSS